MSKNSFSYTSVMLVDDNEIDNLINQKMIESSNLTRNVLVHSGAKSALEFLKNIEKLSEGSSNLMPDLIFLDIDMPIMDGFQFLEEFELLSEETKNKCKIIMLTSSLSPYDLSKAKKNKYIIKFLNKPLTIENLEKISEI